MNHVATNDPGHVLGRSDLETPRLAQQAELFEPSLRRLLTEAGITTGMAVLDLGSGSGDVAMLAAEMVGPTGCVLGIDSNPAVLSTARAGSSRGFFAARVHHGRHPRSGARAGTRCRGRVGSS